MSEHDLVDRTDGRRPIDLANCPLANPQGNYRGLGIIHPLHRLIEVVESTRLNLLTVGGSMLEGNPLGVQQIA